MLLLLVTILKLLAAFITLKLFKSGEVSIRVVFSKVVFKIPPLHRLAAGWTCQLLPRILLCSSMSHCMVCQQVRFIFLYLTTFCTSDLLTESVLNPVPLFDHQGCQTFFPRPSYAPFFLFIFLNYILISFIFIFNP